MSRTEEASRTLFDRWAEHYDAAVQGAGPLAGHDASLQAAASLLPVAPDMLVLDVGIGTGAFAARLAARGARISGVEPSARMRALCQGKHPAFVLTEGTFTALPFADGTFPAVISSFALHEVAPEKRGVAMAEVARVLRPGGWVCLVDLFFASAAAREAARATLGDRWDDEEEYSLVGEVDALLHANGFAQSRWLQTAPCHWVVLAQRCATV